MVFNPFGHYDANLETADSGAPFLHDRHPGNGFVQARAMTTDLVAWAGSAT